MKFSEDDYREAWRHANWRGTVLTYLGDDFFGVENRGHRRGGVKWAIDIKNLGEFLNEFYIWADEMSERYGDFE